MEPSNPRDEYRKKSEEIHGMARRWEITNEECATRSFQLLHEFNRHMADIVNQPQTWKPTQGT